MLKTQFYKINIFMQARNKKKLVFFKRIKNDFNTFSIKKT